MGALTIEDTLKELKSRWEKEKSTRDVEYNTWVDSQVITEYYNPKKGEWTSVELWAFEGFVAKELEGKTQEIFNRDI